MADNGQFASPTKLRVSQAAKAVGRARSTLNRDIANGKVSVTRTGTGQPFIELAELERAYGRLDIGTLAEMSQIGHRDTPTTDASVSDVSSDSRLLRREVELLRERLAEKDTVINDLRQQRDRDAEERRRLMAMLTDQRVIATPGPIAPARRRGWKFWSNT